MHFSYLIFVLCCSGVLSTPIEDTNKLQDLHRSIRSPTFKKKPGGLLLGGLLGGTGSGHGGGGGGNYITNINNYGPSQAYHPQQTANYGHGHEGGSFAGSAAVAGGHGQAQSQSASFAFGPYAASFSQSQAQNGRRGVDYFDY